MSIRIGITTSFADDEQQLRRDYVQAVERAGGVPIPLPTTESDATVRDLVDLIDGLIVTGGPAVTEGLVGSLPGDLDALDPVRNASDGRYLDAALDTGCPILGICYGMQRLNARFGGTIYGDVQHQLDGAMAHSQKRGATTHTVQIHETSTLRSLLDTDTITVNTRHLQALASLGTGFTAAATAPDGVVEAIEHETGRILGVQFHPERMGEDMQPIFRYLIGLARSPQAPAPVA